MDRLEQLFQQFVRERTYINNVTSSTCEWYDTAWKAFQRTPNASAPPIRKRRFTHSWWRMGQRGVKPIDASRSRPLA